MYVITEFKVLITSLESVEDEVQEIGGGPIKAWNLCLFVLNFKNLLSLNSLHFYYTTISLIFQLKPLLK